MTTYDHYLTLNIFTLIHGHFISRRLEVSVLAQVNSIEEIEEGDEIDEIELVDDRRGVVFSRYDSMVAYG